MSRGAPFVVPFDGLRALSVSKRHALATYPREPRTIAVAGLCETGARDVRRTERGAMTEETAASVLQNRFFESICKLFNINGSNSCL